MINRMNSYRLTDTNKLHELHIIGQIIANNCYGTSIVKRLRKSGHKDSITDNKDSWVKFTYFGRETRVITKLFKGTQLRVSYKVNSTINKRLTFKPYNPEPSQQYAKSGVYCLTCSDCHKTYIGLIIP